VHEGGLADGAVTALLAAAAGRPVTRVRVVVGPGVDVEAVRAQWEHAVEATPLAAAAVEWAAAADEPGPRQSRVSRGQDEFDRVVGGSGVMS
jgi:hypothetical protein